jgi:hypothetical protein
LFGASPSSSRASVAWGRAQKMIAAIIDARLASAAAGDDRGLAFFGHRAGLNDMKVSW